MTAIEIEYCDPCGLLRPALRTEQTLLEALGKDVEEVTLRPGSGGVFKIRVDNEVVWDKDVHGGNLDLGLITDVIQERSRAVKQRDTPYNSC